MVLPLDYSNVIILTVYKLNNISNSKEGIKKTHQTMAVGFCVCSSEHGNVLNG